MLDPTLDALVPRTFLALTMHDGSTNEATDAAARLTPQVVCTESTLPNDLRSHYRVDGVEVPAADILAGWGVKLGKRLDQYAREHVFIRVDGCVHLQLDSEHLLCGIATFDAADSEHDEALRWHPTPTKRVTCDVCAGIIRLCAGVPIGKTRAWAMHR